MFSPCLYPGLYRAIGPISQWHFPLGWAARTMNISSKDITPNHRLYCNISQILLLYKTWGSHHKFDCTKSLGVYYWCVKIRFGYLDHGLRYIAFYVQKHITHLEIFYNRPLVRDKPLRAPAFLRLIYSIRCTQMDDTVVTFNHFLHKYPADKCTFEVNVWS